MTPRMFRRVHLGRFFVIKNSLFDFLGERHQPAVCSLYNPWHAPEGGQKDALGRFTVLENSARWTEHVRDGGAFDGELPRVRLQF